MNMHVIVSLLACVAAADIVLLRHQHGHGKERHTDVIGCVYEQHDTEQLFSAEKLLERVVLPDALWCDHDGSAANADAAKQVCHDSTSGRAYNATSVHCDETLGAPVRCTVRIDCSTLIRSFWQSLALTLLVICGFIIVPGVFCSESAAHRRHARDYEKDTSL